MREEDTVCVGTSKREAIASMKMEKAKTLLNTNRGEECE